MQSEGLSHTVDHTSKEQAVLDRSQGHAERFGLAEEPPAPRTYLVLSFLSLSLLFLIAGSTVAFGVDSPADYSSLGIPLPIPDARYFISGGLCAAASHGVTTPIDVVKTRIQADPKTFRGLGTVEAAQLILKQDGPEALLSGLAPTLVGYGLEGSAKFGIYESLKPTFAAILAPIIGGSQALPYLGASVAAGAVASIMLCPLERTRIRMVTDPSFASGLVPGLLRFAEEEGVLNLFGGGLTAMLSKQVPYTFSKQVSFDVVARSLYRAAYAANLSPVNVKSEVSVAAAFCASVLACIASHPGDVVLTDTYKETNGGSLPSFVDVVNGIKEEEGLSGFFAGITARFLHVGAIITSQLVLYDFIKQLLGLPATGTT